MQFAKETRFVFPLKIPFQEYKEAFKHVEQLVFQSIKWCQDDEIQS